jgi:hypothetical protein
LSSAHNAFEEAVERDRDIRFGRYRLIPLAAAIIATAAALSTLFAHHRSISALAIKNEAILVQAKASDQFAYYQAKRIKYTVSSLLLVSGVARDAASRAALKSTADHEGSSSLAILSGAQKLEHTAEQEQARSEVILRSFETLEIATTLFDIAIVFVSISALSGARVLLYFGSALSLIGIGFMVVGYLQPH